MPLPCARPGLGPQDHTVTITIGGDGGGGGGGSGSGGGSGITSLMDKVKVYLIMTTPSTNRDLYLTVCS